MSKAIRPRRAAVAASLVVAALAAGSATAAAATPLQPVRAAVPPPLALLLPNLATTNPSPGTYRITNTGIAPTGSFVVRIHRVGVKAGGTFVVPSLSRGQSYSHYLGNFCGTGFPPAFEVVADSTNLVHESNESDNAVVLLPTHNC
jgi:subtilase family serine protease